MYVPAEETEWLTVSLVQQVKDHNRCFEAQSGKRILPLSKYSKKSELINKVEGKEERTWSEVAMWAKADGKNIAICLGGWANQSDLVEIKDLYLDLFGWGHSWTSENIRGDIVDYF